MAKANLTWEKKDGSRIVLSQPAVHSSAGDLLLRSNSQTRKVKHGQVSSSQSSERRAPSDKPAESPNSAGSSDMSDGMAGTLKALCGTEDWGVCQSFETRWKGAFNARLVYKAQR